MKILIFGAATSRGLSSFGVRSQLYGGGWVENLVNGLKENYDLDLYVAFFLSSVKKIEIESGDGINYIAIPNQKPKSDLITPGLKKSIKEMIALVDPDVVHIIGTEREYKQELVDCLDMDRVVISLTGLLSVCGEHYFGQIDKGLLSFTSIGDILRGTSPKKEKEKFITRGKAEKLLLVNAKHVMGRTSWDYACAKKLNPNVNYIYCSEILNSVYKEGKWEADKCEKHSIFLSQANYPIKGLHRMFEAFAEILKKYPDAKLYIAGEDIWKRSNLKDFIKQNTYAKFLYRLAHKLCLPLNQICFTGFLSPEQMKERYLLSNVFVMPSIIENSPNSLGEAMSLGVPCVASYVGGIPDMITHNVDGFLYACDEPYMLAHYVCKVFENDIKAAEMGKSASMTAFKRFDDKDTLETTYKTYTKICQSKR